MQTKGELRRLRENLVNSVLNEPLLDSFDEDDLMEETDKEFFEKEYKINFKDGNI